MQEPTNWRAPYAASCTVQQRSTKRPEGLSREGSWGRKESNKVNTDHLVLLLQTNSCLPLCASLFVYLLWGTWWQGIKSPSLRFTTSLWLWNSHLPFLGMNQMPWNNKPTGSIIIPSPCNQHSRLMRQKMKTSARENLLVLFKVPKEKHAQTGTDSCGDHEKLIRPEMKMRSLFPANQIVQQLLTSSFRPTCQL